MKQLLSLLILMVLSSPVFAADLPSELTCQGVKKLFIIHHNFKMYETSTSQIFIIRNNTLSISMAPPDKGMYVYGEITKIEDLRYTSGHKTILFEDDFYERGVIVQSNN